MTLFQVYQLYAPSRSCQRMNSSSPSSFPAVPSSAVALHPPRCWCGTTSCLGAEVRRIWARKFSGATVLYCLLRYGTLLEKITIMVLASWDMTPHGCDIVVRFQIFPFILRTVGFGLFSSLRVYALMGHDWRLASFVFLLCLPAAINPSYVYAHQWSPGVDRYGCQLAYMASQEVHERRECLRISGIVADILSESIVICVTVVKTFQLRKNISDDGDRSKKPGLAQLFLRDGTIYFLILLVLSLADMLVLVFDHVPQSVIGYDYWVVPYFTPVFRTIIICRFMLMLRAIYFAQDDERHETLETMRYVSRVAGSMGATIDPTMTFDDTTDAEDDSEIVYAPDPFAKSMAMDLSSSSGSREDSEKSNSSNNNSVDLKEFPWAAGMDAGQEELRRSDSDIEVEDRV